MTLRKAERVLDEFLKKLMPSIGFRHAALLEYSCEIGDAIAKLSWPCRLDPHGFAAFTVIIELQYEFLSCWHSEGRAMSVASPLHFLRADKSFAEWEFASDSDLESLSDQISRDLNEFAIPYIRQYSSIHNLLGALQSSNPEDWSNLGRDPDSRVCLLAAIQMHLGDKTNAIKTLDLALAERMSASIKHRYDIEKLRMKMLKANQADGQPQE